MIICPNCSRENEDHYKFCLGCGTELSKAAAPALKASHGAIVSTASIAGLGRAGSSLAYGATKAGVVSLTQNLARALAPEVRVNAIAPGAVDSSWMVEWTNEERQQSIEKALQKRRCTTDDLAEVVLFLGFGAAMVTVTASTDSCPSSVSP